MDSFNKFFDIFSKINAIEKDKLAYIQKCDSLINNYTSQISELASKTNSKYDFYQSYKHYIEMSKDPNYFSVYYKVNNRFLPIITDLCIHGQRIENRSYDDYNKIGTGRLNDLTIYCDSANVDTFLKPNPLHRNLYDQVENYNFD